jgi:hypothetical protein
LRTPGGGGMAGAGQRLAPYALAYHTKPV